MAIITTVTEFTEDTQRVLNVRFPYLDDRRVASQNGSPTFFRMKCLFTIAVELEIIWLKESIMFLVERIENVKGWPS